MSTLLEQPDWLAANAEVADLREQLEATNVPMTPGVAGSIREAHELLHARLADAKKKRAEVYTRLTRS